MPPDLPPPNRLTRRLIEHGRTLGASGPYTAHPAAAVLDRLYLDLARWVGFDGCHALFTRALAEARAEYALLETIKLQPRATPYLEGVADTVGKYGSKKTDEALEAMLAILIAVLGRLIGEEMAANLIERGIPESADDTSRENRRAEA